MTSEQREAALEVMGRALAERENATRYEGGPSTSPMVEPPEYDAGDYLDVTEPLLDALLTGFVVIAKGDVIWVCKHHGADVDHLMLHDGRACAHIAEDGSYCRTRLARTHWEPTTTPEAFA